MQKHGTTKKTRNKAAAILATMAAIICFFVLSSTLMPAKAVDVSIAAHVHELYFEQQELVRLLADAIAEEREADFDALDALGARWQLPDGLVLPPEMQPQALQKSWVRQQLEGKIVLDTRVEEDGCVVFVAFDTGQLQLAAVVVNATEEIHAFVLRVEQYGSEMSALTETYRMKIDGAEEELPASEDISVPESSSKPAADTSEPAEALQEEPVAAPANMRGKTAMVMPLRASFGAAEDTAGGGSEAPAEPPVSDAQASEAPPESVPQPESVVQPAEEAVSTPEQEILSEPLEEETTGQEITFSIETQESDSFNQTQNGVAVVVLPGGMGVITLNTGLLHGGPLTAAPRKAMMRSMVNPLTGIQLWTGAATPSAASGNHGVLRIYHKDQGTAQTPGYDYATYSATGHGVAYDIDAGTDIIIHPFTTTYRYFTVELHNTKPVSVKSVGLQATTLQNPNNGTSGASNDTTLNIVSKAENPTLNIATDSGNAITYAGYLNLTGPAAINAAAGADGWAIGRNAGLSYTNTMKIDGVALAATGGSGIDARSALTVNGSVLNLSDITGIADANTVHVAGAFTLTASQLNLKNVTGAAGKDVLHVTGAAATTNATISLQNVAGVANGVYVAAATSNLSDTTVLLDNVACGANAFHTAATRLSSVRFTAKNGMAAAGDIVRFNSVTGDITGAVFDIDMGTSAGHGLYIGSAATMPGVSLDIRGGSVAAGNYLMRTQGTVTISNAQKLSLAAGESGGGGLYSGVNIAISGTSADFSANNMDANSHLLHAAGTTTVTGGSIKLDTGNSAGGGLYSGGVLVLDSTILDFAADNMAAGATASASNYLINGRSAVTARNGAKINLDTGNSAGGGLYSGGALALNGVSLDFDANNMAAGTTASASNYLINGRSTVTISNGTTVDLNTGESAGGGLYSDSVFRADGTSALPISITLNGNAVSKVNGLLYGGATAYMTYADITINGAKDAFGNPTSGNGAGHGLYIDNVVYDFNNCTLEADAYATEGYVVCFSESNMATERTLTDSNITIRSHNSTGTAFYLGMEPTLSNFNIDIKANGSVKPVMEVNADNSIWLSTTITIDAGNSPGKSLFVHEGASTTSHIFRMGQTGTTAAAKASSSSLVITRGESEQDAWDLEGYLYMYQTSKVDVRSDSEFGRNIYLYRLRMYNESSIYAKGNPWSATFVDPGTEEPDEPVDPEEPEEPEEPEDPDDTGDSIAENTELNSYRSTSDPNNIAAVFYARRYVRLYDKGCSLIVEGNADTQKDNDKITPVALVVDYEELRASKGAVVKGTNARIGIRCYNLLLNDSALPTNVVNELERYDTVATIDNPAKSRAIGDGVDCGIIIVGYLDMRTAANVYAKGGTSGLMMRRTYNTSTDTLNYRRGSAIIAHGTGENGSGLVVTQDAFFTTGVRVVAKGTTNGVLLTQRASRLQIGRQSQLVATGEKNEGAGIYFGADFNQVGNIRAYRGGKIYARGAQYGVYARNSNVESYNTSATYGISSLTGIGGIADENMKSILDTLNTGFVFEDLPMPKLTEGNNASQVWDESEIEVPGLVIGNGVPRSAGVVTGGSTSRRIYCRRYKSELYGYGGEWGIVNDSAALDDDGGDDGDGSSGGTIYAGYTGIIEGHGGKIGISAKTYLRSYGSGGHTYIRGFGEEYGIKTSLDLRSSGSANAVGYMYGIGKINGLYAGRNYRSDNDGCVVGETWIDPEAETGAMTEPAVKAVGRRDSGLMRLNGARALIHEIYNPINMVFVTPDPYQFNTEFAAVGQNMGEDPNVMKKYKWTTPKSHPNPYDEATNPLDWNDYVATDDQRLLMAVDGTDRNGNPRPGLVAFGYSEDATVVGNRFGNFGTASTSDGNIYGTAGTHRQTFRHVKLRDLRTMQVKIDLREMLAGANLSLTDIPPTALYELEFRPFDPEGLDKDNPVQTIQLTDGVAGYDKAAGTITLHKLRLGEYVLKPKVQLGWPFKNLPDIPFTVDIDRRASADGPGGYMATWPVERWVESVFTGSYVDEKWVAADKAKVTNDTTTGTDGYVHTGAGHTKLAVPDTADPSIAPPDGPPNQSDDRLLFKNLYNVTSYYVGEFEAYYEREQYKLDFKLMDYESGLPLPGSFEVTTTRDGQPVTSLPVKTYTNAGTNTAPRWNITGLPITVYGGLEYQFVQKTSYVGAGYLLDSAPFKVKLDKDPASDPQHQFTVLQENPSYYRFTTDNADVPTYNVYARNIQVGTQIPLEVIKHDDYKNNILNQYLQNCDFKIIGRFADGSTSDVTATTLIKEADGTFKLNVKNGVTYFMQQTASQSGYAPRKSGSYSFEATIRYVAATGAFRDIALSKTGSTVSVEEGSDGWVSAVNISRTTDPAQALIRITNLLGVGDLNITVNATGLWTAHDDAVFIVELRGSSDTSRGYVYYDIVELPGSTALAGEAYKTALETGTAQFKNIQAGSYTVTVHGALRTENAITKENIKVQSDTQTEVFNFTCGNYHYLSGGDAIQTEFKIDFSS